MRAILFFKLSVKRLFAPVAGVLLALIACAPRVACGATNNVAVTNFVFVPPNITIAPGDTVLWTWGTGLHSTTSDTNGLWDSGVQSTPFSFSHTFASPGTYPYHCTVHQSIGMVGAVTVAAVNVAVTNFVFIPADVTIAAGDTVLWTWGAGGHTTTSDTNGLWDSGFQTTPFSFSHTFASPGTFPYHCTIHQSIGMVGAVTVAAVNVAVTNFVFIPANITINPGDTVLWTWQIGGHTTTSDTNGLWDSGFQTTPFSFSHTFASAGTFPYHCTVHQSIGMVGSVTVQGAPVPILLSSPERLSATSFQFQYTATPGLSYVVQRAGSLPNFSPLSTNTAASSPVTFLDTNASADVNFYSVKRLPNP